jgi:ferritin-like metal-binding protein YciE
MKRKEEVISWLRDAYAMERGLEVTLKKQADSDDYDPEIRQAAEEHLEETRQHARMVERLLKSLGSNTSAIKTGVGMMTETIKVLGTSMSHDEQIKDLLTGYAMEHFEIACYRALSTAAETAGLENVADACDQIIGDEERMAERLSDALPEIVEKYLGESEASANTRA